MEIWNLSLIATEYRKRPSEIVGIDDEWAAYQLDQATRFVGTFIHNKLDELDKDGKPIYTSVQQILGTDVVTTLDTSKLKRITGIVVEKR